MGRVETRKASRCGECGTITYPATYKIECDTCGKELTDNDKRRFLDFHYFRNDHQDAEDIIVCDWKCYSAWVQQILPYRKERMGFCNMPYVQPEQLDELISILKPSTIKKKRPKTHSRRLVPPLEERLRKNSRIIPSVLKKVKRINGRPRKA